MAKTLSEQLAEKHHSPNAVRPLDEQYELFCKACEKYTVVGRPDYQDGFVAGRASAVEALRDLHKKGLEEGK